MYLVYSFKGKAVHLQNFFISNDIHLTTIVSTIE